MDRFLTTRQLAELLNVSERHIYRLKAAGKFPKPRRFGRSIRWDPRDFQGDGGKRGNNDTR
jgi:excisionase family DNA binding protein